MKQVLIVSLIALSGVVMGANNANNANTAGAVEPNWKILKEEGQRALYFRVLEEGGVGVLNLKVVNGENTSVEKGQLLYLKTATDVIKLSAAESTSACRGCGSYKVVSYRNVLGLDVKYAFSKATADMMMKSDLETLRVITSDGYVEFDITPQNQAILRNALSQHYSR